MKSLAVLCCLVGLVLGNDYDTVGKHCDHNGDKRLNMAEFSCIFMQFDKGAYDGFVDEHEFEAGWKSMDLHYKERAPLFFIETDVTGDFRVGKDDMAYLKAIWDTNEDGFVDENELKYGWQSFFYDRFES